MLIARSAGEPEQLSLREPYRAKDHVSPAVTAPAKWTVEMPETELQFYDSRGIGGRSSLFQGYGNGALTDLGRNRSNLPGASLICVRSTVQTV